MIILGFYHSFYRAEGFLLSVDTMKMSLAAMDLEPKEWDVYEINTFERFLQYAVHLLDNTQ